MDEADSLHKCEYILHRLKMGKMEIDNATVSMGIFDFVFTEMTIEYSSRF